MKAVILQLAETQFSTVVAIRHLRDEVAAIQGALASHDPAIAKDITSRLADALLTSDASLQELYSQHAELTESIRALPD